MNRCIVPLLSCCFTLLGAPAAAGPAVQSSLQAVARLGAVRSGAQAKAAVEAVNQACRGKLRHALRDHPPLLSRAQKMAASEDPQIRRAALDLDRCFTPAKFITVVGPRLRDPDPKVLTYAAEIAARMADPVVVGPLLAAFDERRAGCAAPGLAAPDVDVCVWLTYAPGAALDGADEPTRAAAASRAVAMFEAPYPKVREVAVETVASAGLKVHAAALKALIAKEKAGDFSPANDAPLLKRFKKRLKALRRGR